MEKSKERIIKLHRYCSDINGLRVICLDNHPLLNTCSNEHCVNCRELDKIFIETFNKIADATKKENL